MKWYSLIYDEENYEASRQTFAAFADPDNYPMNFHCAVGRDRTGTTAFFILGLLGVDEETLLREYYSSFFSQSGSCDRDELVLHVANIHGLMNGLSRYAPAAAPLRERIESYMLAVGVTEEEIAAIREILLEP
jgi:protein-tyrosine phosphatase